MKLKPIPNNTVVHTPTEAEAKELLTILNENGYKWYCSGKEEGFENFGDETCYRINSKAKVYHTCDREWYETICLHCILPILTLAEFKERYVLNEDNFAKSEEEKPQPKFKVDDIVAIRWINKWGRITNVHFSEEAEGWEYNIKVYPKGLATALESNLEPYTEPETKPTEGMEAKELNRCEKCGATTQQCMDTPCQDYPVEKELNLVELLKGHEGETFYSPVCGTDIELKKVFKSFLVFYLDKDDDCTIECETRGWQRIGTLDKYGTFKSITYPDSACLIYPSRALYEQYPLDPQKAWMKWQEEQTIYHIRIEFQPYDERGEMKCGNMGTLHFDDLKFRTPADRDKCIGEIKAIIEKYSKK